ncbi:hypothetical protein [Tellurirhabdus bombi]|uniref:hypothetical protein n=1 Tax=Tellurirhabdus bombi TaxID=2907205 RepID=UPI001F2F7365|nr:hypothetical protein [Tellurirhabdus bombi]
MLAIAGYFGYRWWTAPIRSPWELIPSDALIVLESTALQDTVSKESRLNELSLRTTPVFQEAVQAVDQFIWPALDTTDALKLLRSKPIWYSLHRTSRDKLEFAFYLPLKTAEDRALVNRLLKPNADRFRTLSHPYEKERIHEFLTVGNESLGSFVVLDDFLVGSPSTIVIESVVRRIHQRFSETPLQRADVTLLQPGTIAGLYVRSSVLESLLTSPLNTKTDWQARYIRTFLPTEIKTQFQQSINRTHLLGKSVEDIGTQSAVASLFSGQIPGRIACGNLIPDQTTSVFHIGLSDGAKFGAALTPFINAEQEGVFREGRRKLRPLLQRDATSFYQYLGNEVALLKLDASFSEQRMILLVKSPNVEKLYDRYQLAAVLLSGKDQLAKTKSFLKHPVTLIDAPDLPAHLFGGLFRGFSRSWVTQEKDYLIIANSEEVMQEYLQALRDETVWSVNRRQLDLLTKTLRPANFTVFTRFGRAGESIAAQWPTAWQQLLNHDDTALDNIENLVYQSSYGRDRIYSTIVLGRTSRRASEAVFNRVFLQKNVDFNAPLANAPLPLGDFVGGSGQIWAIDNSRQFVQITPYNDKRVIGSIDGAIKSQLIPVNYLDNGRLQYAFTTAQSLYFADSYNGFVRLQSVRLPKGANPSLLSLARGLSDRAQILLLGHQDGSVFAFDKTQKRFIRQFSVTSTGEACPPYQTIFRNQNLSVLSLQKEGKLNKWQQNGNQAPGFPLDLQSEFSGPAFMDGSTPATITTLGKQGEFIRISEEGKILEKSQLYRPVRRGTFHLLIEEGQKDYLVLRTTDTETAILDHNGKSLFEVRGLVPGRTTIRYHIFGSGLKLVSVKSGNFTSLYHLNGRPFGDRPIPGLYPVNLQYSPSRNKLFIYSSTEKAVQVWSIKLR